MINLICIQCGRRDEVPVGTHQHMMDAPCLSCGALMIGADNRLSLWAIEHPWLSVACIAVAAAVAGVIWIHGWAL